MTTYHNLRRMHPQPSACVAAHPPLKIGRSLCWALLWVLVDGFVLAQGAFAMVCVVYVLFYALPRALIAFKTRERRNYYLMRAAVFGAVPPVVGCIYAANLRVGERNAQIIIAAVDSYHAEHKQYPQTLQALVPKYLPEIPPAKYAFIMPNYWYISRGNMHHLMYTTLPPFGRKVYNFTTRSWSGLD